MRGGFCTTCGHHVDTFEGLSACPKCGNTGIPCADENQVTVNINTHELRILCMWAENWAIEKNCGDVVYAIAARLRRQLAKERDLPLTMADELRELKAAHPQFETNHPAADDPELAENYNPNLGKQGDPDDGLNK